MVKDDLATFQTVFGIYNKSDRCEAIKNFFGRLSCPDFYLFIFVCVVVGTFVCIVTALALLLDPEGRDTLLMTMGLISGIGVSYFYLLKKYSQIAGSAERYKDLLSDKFYQYDRYITFKEKLDQNKGLSLAPVTALIQSKLLIAQGWGAFPVSLLGIFVSLMITVIYSSAPGDPKENFLYIIGVTYFLVLLFMMIFACYDPLMNKNNKYRELLLFITIYESDAATEDRT